MAIDLQELSKKLKHLRKDVLKQELEDVASQSGIHIEALREMEQGRREPTGDQILILSDVYKQELAYFITGERVDTFEKVNQLFRKFDKELTPQDRMNIQEFLYLCRCEHDFETMMGGRPRIIHFDPNLRGTFFKGHGWENAERLRKEFGFQDKPLVDVFGIARKLGYHIFRRKLGRSAISGVFIRHREIGNCILVNYNEDLYRQDFSALHELAHAIFDKDYQVNLSLEDEQRGPEERREWRANAFAGRMLIPRAKLERMDTSGDSELVADEVKHLCREYRANFDTGLYAMKDADRLTQDQVDDLKGTRKISQAEKDDAALVGHAPKVKVRRLQLMKRGLSPEYVGVCFEAYHRGLISQGRLAEALLIQLDEMPEIAEMYGEPLEMKV
ncbi:MAG: XRE family transcriptional regulator [Candidatus Lernaella stagnicola]|nr:XRE family transcriptional regulator [Candidatus Lernaella stagnicola]